MVAGNDRRAQGRDVVTIRWFGCLHVTEANRAAVMGGNAARLLGMAA